MKHIFIKWLRTSYNKIIGSIAFYPALIAIGFLLMSWLMLELDFSPLGKHIKSNYDLVRLRDANTARTIASTIVGGIISLTVFSFSMVMILLNQAASQLSNRTLEGMISNRFQQIVLGFYIGTIVYALFLLSTIRNVDSGIYVPALSIYLLLLFAVADIFLFIYFLHYITQTIKFETIIKRVHQQTLKTLQAAQLSKSSKLTDKPAGYGQIIKMPESNYYQDFDKRELMHYADKYKGVVSFLYPKGTYLLKGIPLMEFYAENLLTEKQQGELLDILDFYIGQPIKKNAYFGFHQLTEIALKALSPGINDPQTAVLCIHALTDLFAYVSANNNQSIYFDKNEQPVIFVNGYRFQDLFQQCYPPIWSYGKDDQFIRQTLKFMLTQLLGQLEQDDLILLVSSFLKTVEDKTDDA